MSNDELVSLEPLTIHDPDELLAVTVLQYLETIMTEEPSLKESVSYCQMAKTQLFNGPDELRSRFNTSLSFNMVLNIPEKLIHAGLMGPVICKKEKVNLPFMGDGVVGMRDTSFQVIEAHLYIVEKDGPVPVVKPESVFDLNRTFADTNTSSMNSDRANSIAMEFAKQFINQYIVYP